MSEFFRLENLHEYDGGALQIMFNEAILKVMDDLLDRPRMKKAREVAIKFAFSPRVDSKGDRSGLSDLEEIDTEVSVAVKIPDKECRTNILKPQPSQRAMVFEPSSRRVKSLPGQADLPLEDEPDAEEFETE